ncbi:MAG: DUF4190 domain-containing protein [Gemmataceae bacterium]|nr:DUF4190 domain-containing protein [Gemmataceae bacterium]
MSQQPSDRGQPYYAEDRPRRAGPPRGDGGVSTIIPYMNPKSLVAYYCGVFGLIPVLGLILGPLALTFGILALKYVKQNPTAKGTGHAITGIVLGTLTLLGHLFVLVVFGAAIFARR